MAAPRPQPTSRVPDLSEVRRLLAERLESREPKAALDLMLEMLSKLQAENSQLALRLDSALNATVVRVEGRISPTDAPLPAYVIPTDEEFVIARETARYVGEWRDECS